MALLISSTCWAESVTYRVIGNAQACAEIQIPKWTRPAKGGDSTWPVGTWGCQFDVRNAGGASIYIGLSCGSSIYWRMQEKYSVDLSNPKNIRKIDEPKWDAAIALEPWNHYGEPEQARFQVNGLEYQGHLFAKSGPQWDLYSKALASPGRSRVTVFSYDGTVQRSYEFSSKPEHFDGTYWTEIYDVSSTKRLIQIRGAFHGVDLTEVQGKSSWLGGRYFLQPLEAHGMRRLLICDVDEAARSSGVTESDAPVPLSRAKPYYNHSTSNNQWRSFETETPQAHIVAIRDEPVFSGAAKIESISVTALLDVQAPGNYRLSVHLEGIEATADGALSAGSSKITVSFPVASLRNLGRGGPYKIDSARLTRLIQDGNILADNRFSPELAKAISAGIRDDQFINASTQPYSLASLGSSLYFTGENSATLVPGKGLEPDRLEVRIGFYSQAAACRGGGMLARTSPPKETVIGPPGQQSMVLSFSGGEVSSPGPYRMEHVVVLCGADFIGPTSIVVPRNP
jgi:hypothetical protein